MSELPKTFDPAAIEAKWYAHWEQTGAFRPARPDAEPFTIVNPPPNVTGSLHIGHALDNTLQDVLIRHARLKGKDALWVVGTDHAGIATQMVVERQLNEKQQKRTDFSREEFVAKVWEWKTESGGEITRQLRRLGCSMDWANERFTMDEGFSKAVIKVFVDLYNQGLLYRDKRLVNWDPGLKTAISDLEVETTEVAGKFWHFKYPLADGSGHISVATTRPETMLADMAVAVSPGDPRYAAMVGKMVKLPITGREIPIIEDEHADPELGSGAVKITPGHDFNDFEVGKRAGFKPADMLNMLDAEAKVVQTADGLIPDDLLGLTVKEARAKVVDRIDGLGLLEKVEDRMIATPFGDRSGAVIEPWLTDQWYVDAQTLAQPAIKAVRDGDIQIVPKTWEKTWFNWMENIQPWCVSRQLWWGHRIPAWYGAPKETYEAADFTPPQSGPAFAFYDGHVEVAESDEEALRLFSEYYAVPVQEIIIASENPEGGWGWERHSRVIFRDRDVLDTWFSSALWPFATLGWPEQPTSSLGGEVDASATGEGAQSPGVGTPSPARALREASSPPRGEEGAGAPNFLTRHYPNDVLVSGFDILFFWDARMAMQGLHFMKEVPWKTLYLHGLVRAADGQKMSKSKGNTVDSLGLIDRYGADALRFFMAAMESQGRDIKMDEKRVEGYRNFATKLWNAARFCQANGIGASKTVAAPEATLAVNKWIIGEVVETLAKLDKAFAEFRFDGMADAIYHFTWGTFCDWYLELIKPVLSPLPFRGGDGGGAVRAEDDADVSNSSGQPHPNPVRPVSGRPGNDLGRTPEGEGLEASETRAVAGWVLDQILVMLHPFMPFITEELWEKLGDRGCNLLIHAKWPEPNAPIDEDARANVDWLIRLISEVRTARTELNVPPGARLPFAPVDDDPANRDRLQANEAVLGRLARVTLAPATGGQAQIVVDDVTYALALGEAIDLDAERARISKAIEASGKEAASLSARLNNPAFVEKAKPEAVEKARADHAEKAAEVERLQTALARLG